MEVCVILLDLHGEQVELVLQTLDGLLHPLVDNIIIIIITVYHRYDQKQRHHRQKTSALLHDRNLNPDQDLLVEEKLEPQLMFR